MVKNRPGRGVGPVAFHFPSLFPPSGDGEVVFEVDNDVLYTQRGREDPFGGRNKGPGKGVKGGKWAGRPTTLGRRRGQDQLGTVGR